jgi:hypothetical protein
MPSRAHETSPARGFPGSSFKYTPLQHVRVLFVSFAQGLFRQAPEGSYRWLPDLEHTEIVITDENPINIEKMEDRPAITFTRSPVQFYSLGIDDMEFFDYRTDKKTKNVLVPGTMNINCLSRVDIESENIAWVISEHVWLLRELFLKQGFFDLGRGNQIGSPSQAGSLIAEDQGDQAYVTTVSVPFQFYRQSSFTPLGHQIARSIELEIDTAIKRVENTSAAQAGHEYPFNEHTCFPPPLAPDASDNYNQTPDPAGTRDVFPLPKQPHPLNPAKRVILRSVRPNQPGLRPPGMGGVSLPIRDPCEGESEL